VETLRECRHCRADIYDGLNNDAERNGDVCDHCVSIYETENAVTRGDVCEHCAKFSGTCDYCGGPYIWAGGE
jgi:hypothetical protein